MGVLGFSSLLGVTKTRLRILEGSPKKGTTMKTIGRVSSLRFERGVRIELSRLQSLGFLNLKA